MRDCAVSIFYLVSVQMELIGFSGRKQAGKDTGAHTLGSFVRRYASQADTAVKYLSMAGPLKEFCRDWFDLPHSAVYGNDEAKNAPTTYRWENLPGNIANGRLGFMSGRQILQVWGSDILRTFFPAIHVHRLQQSITEAKMAGYELATINDLRFPNEVRAVLNMGGTVVRLTRCPFPEDRHESEIALDSWDWEHTPNCVVVDNKEFELREYQDRLIDLFAPRFTRECRA